jgi:hypothetical protein
MARKDRLLKPGVSHKWIFGGLVPLLVLLASCVLAGETTTDSALWTGGLFLFENEKWLDYSVEYQVRLDDHMSSFSSHFLELMGYRKTTENLLLNGGYRFTMRPDHVDHRLYLGGFWELTRNTRDSGGDPNRFRATLQFGYQHDFNAKFDNQLMGSNSIRWILVASKPVTEKMTPFLVGGILTTWNDAYSFGIDKIRLGGGVAFQISQQSRLRFQYILEKARFMTPEKRTNIIWLRYEMNFGK